MCSPELSPLSWPSGAWDGCSPSPQVSEHEHPSECFCGVRRTKHTVPHSPEPPFPPQPQTLEHPANPSVSEFIPHKPQTSLARFLPLLRWMPRAHPSRLESPLPRGPQESKCSVASPLERPRGRCHEQHLQCWSRWGPSSEPHGHSFPATKGRESHCWAQTHTRSPFRPLWGHIWGEVVAHPSHTGENKTQSHRERASHPHVTASCPGWSWLGHLASEPASLFAHKS